MKIRLAVLAFAIALGTPAYAQDNDDGIGADARLPCIGCGKRIMTKLGDHDKALKAIDRKLDKLAKQNQPKSAIEVRLPRVGVSRSFDFLTITRVNKFGNQDTIKQRIKDIGREFCHSMEYDNAKVIDVNQNGDFWHVDRVICYDSDK